MTQSRWGRREFLRAAAGVAAAASLPRWARAADAPPFRISLAEWSLNRELRGGKLDNLDFARVARQEFGIEAIEYVNQFFMDKAGDSAYLAELNRRAADQQVKQLLIMVDREGALGDADEAKRTKAVENHYKWVEAAKTLGCHAIRVNAQSQGTYDEQQQRAADGLRRLCEFAAPHGIDVIVENHGGLSSNGAWLAGTIRKVNLPNCGTLPDFGNFRVSPTETYDKYRGVEELMPLAKAVSAKCYAFGPDGDETTIDFRRMLKLVLAAGYHGYVGIEFEGKDTDAYEGIRAAKKLLERLQTELA